MLADKVVIAPVSYRLVWKDAESETKARLVEEQAAAAAVEAGMEPVRGDVVKEAVQKVLGRSDRCVSSDCLAKVAVEVGAEQAVSVSIEESGAQHKIAVALARGEGTVGELFGEMQVVLKGVRSMVKEVLESEQRAEAAAVEPEEKQAGPERIEEEPRPGAIIVHDKPDPGIQLSPVPFYITAGATVALTATALVLDKVVADRWERLSDGDEDVDYWEKSRTLQKVDRAVIGFACAGVVATGVLFFLTDFKGDEADGEGAVSIEVGVASDSAGAIVKGRF